MEIQGWLGKEDATGEWARAFARSGSRAVFREPGRNRPGQAALDRRRQDGLGRGGPDARHAQRAHPQEIIQRAHARRRP